MATRCPITRTEFRERAVPLSVVVNAVPLVAEVREFATRSLGWSATGKMSIEINGKPVAVQIGLNLTVIGSKQLPEEV